METVEIKCLKSILNVAERAKKGKNRYISAFRACSGRRGRRFKSCHPDQQNLSNQAVSEVFDLSEKCHKTSLTTFFHLQLWDKVFFLVWYYISIALNYFIVV